MREFILTSKNFEGSLTFGYNENEVLLSFANNAELNDGQVDFLCKNFPFRLCYLNMFAGEKGKIEEITDVSFENFWDIYNYKTDKINALKFWDKMPNNDKLDAINGIKRYKTRCLMKNTAMIYAVRYLRNRRWEDEQ
ncbi:MAG: hypothetical protein HC896_00395 [Bacteroidales bacterium]|nr:hypothetical protein [Bacteroidales bacterium]